jgi:hypothetical protein
MEIATSYNRPFYEEEVRAIRPPAFDRLSKTGVIRNEQ